VFIAQLGGLGQRWRPVLDRLTTGSATFAYDRRGLGDAPPRPAPNPPLPYGVFADELAALLDEHRVVEPAVLVGHSIGGHIARVFAGQLPDRVAGLVFVDASIPQFKLWWRDTAPVVDGDGRGATEFDILAGEVEVLSAIVPPVPTVVLTRRRRWWLTGETIPHPAVDELWWVSQQLLAQQCHAPLVLADDAGHQIPDEAPQLVAHVVDSVVRAARAGTPPIVDPASLARAGGRTAPDRWASPVHQPAGGPAPS